MENSRVLIYDGSFNGFLTAIHFALGNNIDVLSFQKTKSGQEGLFSDQHTISTVRKKAQNMWYSIEKKSHAAIRNIYFAFLSETNGIEFMLYQYIKKLYGILDIETLEQTAIIEAKIKKLSLQVNREKSYIENSLVFETTDSSVYMTELEPGFNIIPLISRHFRYKYPKHPWIIYDNKRKYGVYYNGISLEMVSEHTKNNYLKVKKVLKPYQENSYRMAM